MFRLRQIILNGEIMIRVTIGIGILCFASAAFGSGPFGIEKGTELSALEGAKEVAANKYSFTPPKAHPEFETYIAIASDSHGVCWLKAIGRDVQTSGYGTELKTKYESFEQKLTKVYGNNKSYDFLMPDSIWDEPKDFMMGLLRNERHKAALWNSAANSKLTDSLTEIGLITVAASRDTGYITIEYKFDNYDACKEEINTKLDQVL